MPDRVNAISTPLFAKGLDHGVTVSKPYVGTEESGMFAH